MQDAQLQARKENQTKQGQNHTLRCINFSHSILVCLVCVLYIWFDILQDSYKHICHLEFDIIPKLCTLPSESAVLFQWYL